jgi:hypothetical protein
VVSGFTLARRLFNAALRLVKGKLSTINPEYERERKRGEGMEGGREGGRGRERE